MDIYFNAMKIKFDDLNAITSPVFDMNKIQSANLFINLDDFNSRFKNVHINQEFQCCGAGAFKQYASNVLNLAAHYRQWLHRKNVKSRIFLYMTTAAGGFTPSSLVNGYRSKYIEKCSLSNADCYYVNMTVNGGFDLIKDMVDYIDGVYLIDSKGEEPSVIPYLIAKESPADWNFILSKDRVEMQYCIYDRFSILYPSSTYGARVINSGNLWSFIAEKESVTALHASQYDARLYPVVLGIVGDRARSVQKVKKIGWRSIFEYLEKIWESNQDHSIVAMIDALDKKITSKGTDPETQYTDNMLALSMKANYDSMSRSSKEYILMQLTDIPDIESLNQINRDPMIFGNYPINIGFLTEQNVTNRPKKILW